MENINNTNTWTWFRDIIIPLLSAGIGGGITLLAIKYSIKSESRSEQEKTFKNSIAAIKTELNENKLRLDDYLKNISHHDVQAKDTLYVQLSNVLWNDHKHEIFKYDKKILGILCKAYLNINKVNDQAKVALSHSDSSFSNAFFMSIETYARNAIEPINNALNNL